MTNVREQDGWSRGLFVFLSLWGMLAGVGVYLASRYPWWYLSFLDAQAEGTKMAPFLQSTKCDLALSAVAGVLASVLIFGIQARKHARPQFLRGCLLVTLTLFLFVGCLPVLIEWYQVFHPLEPESQSLSFGLEYSLCVNVPSLFLAVATGLISGLLFRLVTRQATGQSKTAND